MMSNKLRKSVADVQKDIMKPFGRLSETLSKDQMFNIEHSHIIWNIESSNILSRISADERNRAKKTEGIIITMALRDHLMFFSSKKPSSLLEPD